MRILAFVCLALWVPAHLRLVSGTTTNITAVQTGGRITVIAPSYLRRGSDYHVLISLANSSAPATVELQLVGGRDTTSEQVEAKSVLAHSDETQLVKFTVGAEWPAAEYYLSVAAQAADRSWNFTDERRLVFQPKSFSVFIQTDKAVYKPGQLVQFRALFLREDLTPLAMKAGGEINVTISNPRANIIKQWNYLANYRGLLSLELRLAEESPMLGEYTISVEARGQRFAKRFTVAEYVLPTYEVGIDLPAYATHDEPQIVATVHATYTYDKPVQGHVTLTVQPLVRFTQIATRPLEQAQFRARLDERGRAQIPVDIMRDLKQSRELFEREIEFFALVEEDLTERKYNATRTIKVHESSVKLERLAGGGDLKPGLSQLMRYKVAYQDDTPVEDGAQVVALAYSFRGQQLAKFELRPSGGLIEHELLVPARLRAPSLTQDLEIYPDQLEVEATYRKHKHYLPPVKPRQSESSQYLQIILPQLDHLRTPRPATSGRLGGGGTTSAPLTASSLQVGDELRVLVRATEALTSQVTCQGLARGDIVWALSRDPRNVTEFSFQIKLDARMAPESRVLCFYVRPANQELIGDSRELLVGAGLAQGRNFAKISTSRADAKPGQQVEVGVFTKPNSLVGLLGVDQSVLLLKAGNDLSPSEIAADLKSYGAAQQQVTGSDTQTPNMESLFRGASVVVLTNNHLFDGKWPQFGRPLGNPQAVESSRRRPTADSSGIALGNLLLDHPLQPPSVKLGARNAGADAIRLRTLFPETWLWENGTADAQGQIKFNSRVPDAITSWQLSAFSLSEAHGLALSQGRTSVRVFRPFFVKLNLPHSIIRGETLALQAIVSNYVSQKRPIQARLTLENKLGEFEFVEAANAIEDEEYSQATSQSRTVQVPPQGTASVSFLIKPTKLGHIELKVLAQSELAGDGLVRKLLVKPEGQTQHFNKATLIQLPPGPTQSTWRQNFTLPMPANAVPGSQRVEVSAIGDVLGAGLSNLDDLLRLPESGGDADQNLARLAPQVVVMNYLQKTGRLRELQRDWALRNIEAAYQRQLNFKRPDGSFGEFELPATDAGSAESGTGSVWLTAQALRALKQAAAHVTVDEQVLARATSYLANRAQPDGSVRDEAAPAGIDTPAYLAAHTLEALMARPQLSGQEAKVPEVIERGLDFLGGQLSSGSQLSARELAIMAHVLELAGGKHQEPANQASEKLWARATSQDGGELVHWATETMGEADRPESGAPRSSSPSAGEDAPVTIIHDETSAPEVGGDSQPAVDRNPRETVASADGAPARQVLDLPPPLSPRLVQAGDQSAHLLAPSSQEVETAAWALLAAVKRNELDRALPIVRWLVSKQNSRGGFAATRDTTLALEALAAYAEATNAAQRAPAQQSIEVEFVYPRSGQQATASRVRKTAVESMLVSQQNALVHQRAVLPANVTWVEARATGTGSAVVQVAWEYNLQVAAERPAFYLNPVLDRRSTINYLQLSVCAFCKADQLESSQLALIEVQLPSGYAADLGTLGGLKRHKQIKRVDVAEGETRVLIYVEQLTRQELCFTVPAHRTSRVANNKPVPVTITDLQDRTKTARIFYEPRLASSCDLCQAHEDECAARQKCTGNGGGKATAQRGKPELASVQEQRAQLLRQELLRNQTTAAKMSDKIIASNSTDGNGGGGLYALPSALDLLPVSHAYGLLNEAARNCTSASLLCIH